MYSFINVTDSKYWEGGVERECGREEVEEGEGEEKNKMEGAPSVLQVSSDNGGREGEKEREREGGKGDLIIT